jgi:hypothetical protein
LNQLDVGRDGQVWGKNSNKELFMRAGITEDKEEGTSWVKIDMDLKSIQAYWVTVCTSGDVWIINGKKK